jgi:hypothetical protein
MAEIPCWRDPRYARFFRGASGRLYWLRLDPNRLDYSDRLIVLAIARRAVDEQSNSETLDRADRPDA